MDFVQYELMRFTISGWNSSAHIFFGCFMFVCEWYEESMRSWCLCVFVHSHKTWRTRSSQPSSIIYNPLSSSPAITPHSPTAALYPSVASVSALLPMCPFSSAVSYTVCQFLWVSRSHTLPLFITCLADLDLLAVRHSGGIFFPGGILSTQQNCVSVWHLLEELGHCSLTLSLNGSQFGSREIFPLVAEWRDHVLSQVCRFSSCLKNAWDFCLMAIWFLLCGNHYPLHCRLHFMFILYGGRFVNKQNLNYQRCWFITVEKPYKRIQNFVLKEFCTC